MAKTNNGAFSLSSLTDDVILKQIYATHFHDNEKLDVESLFIIVENILNRATLFVDNVLLGNQETMELSEEKIPIPGFSPPLCMIKQISCEIQCKVTSEKIAHETTLSIFKKLSDYSWEAKAVLTLATFALDYGEFCVHAQVQSSDQLAKSIGMLKRVPLKSTTLQKNHLAFIDLNHVIKVTLAVVKCIIELEKLSKRDTTDVPASVTVEDHTAVDVYWAIITVVASTAELSCLISDVDKRQELQIFNGKLNVILTKLKKQILIRTNQIEEKEAYAKLRKLFQTSKEVMEQLKGLIDPTNKMQPLIDGSTKSRVEIDVLKSKNVLVLISRLDSLDISNDDIKLLKTIYDKIRQEDKYKIVWIPFVEQWTDELLKQFDILKSKMPWYVAHYNLPSASCSFIKEQWHFEGKPIIVVLNPEGKVECKNAYHMIRAFGVKALPFTVAEEVNLLKKNGWVWFPATLIEPNIARWIEEKKCIILYGGMDNTWIQKFAERAEAIVHDQVIMEMGISIEFVNVRKDKPDLFEHFWKGIESLFLSTTDWNTETEFCAPEIKKFLSYRSESGWAVISKETSVVVSGTTSLDVLNNFNEWKESLKEKKDFESTFKEYLDKVIASTGKTSPHCCRNIDISPATAGKLPGTMKCPDCQQVMEKCVSFKCGNKDDRGPANTENDGAANTNKESAATANDVGAANANKDVGTANANKKMAAAANDVGAATANDVGAANE